MRFIREHAYWGTSSAVGAVVAVATAACGGGSTPPLTPATAPPPSVISSLPTSTPPAAGTAQAAAIVIQQPAPAAIVTVPFAISGNADVFEGALIVQVVDAGGKPLCERQVQATSGTGTPGTWQTTIAFAPPGRAAAATIRAFFRSPNDGSEQSIVTRPIQIASTVPAIVVTSPVCNQDVQALSTLAVRGTASVFEAALTVELRDAQGRAVRSNPVIAAEAGPAQAPWQTSFDLTGVPTGAYELVAYSTSAKDGSTINTFAMPVRIST